MPTQEYDKRRNVHERMQIMQKIVNGAPKHILDLGAGTGWFSQWAADQGHHVTAVDPDLRLGHDRVTVVNEQWTDTELEQGRWDIIVGLSVLHHMENWPHVIDRALHVSDVVVFEPPARTEQFDERVLNASAAPAITDYLKWRSFVTVGWSSSAFGQLRPVMVRHRRGTVGSVADGNGWTTREWGEYGQTVADYLGEPLVPGTLNLLPLPPLPPVISKLNAYTLSNGITFQEAQIDGHPCWLVRMPRGNPGLLELMATVNLRETLGLRTGDRVLVT